MSKLRPLHEAYASLITKGRLKPNPNQAALIERLMTLQNQLSSNNTNTPHQGLYIYGSVGSGKTRLMDLFSATLPENISKRRTHFHTFMLDIHKRLHHARKKDDFAGDPLIRIGHEISAESKVLCFDEFQVSDIADAMILKRLFGAIWAGGGIMVSTSNRHPTKLYENGLNRLLFVPFIKEVERRSEVWKLQGEEDYRLSPTNERDEVYFTDAEAFESALSRATEGKKPSPHRIQVMMGRSLLVEAYKPTADLGWPIISSPTNMLEITDKTIVTSTFKDLLRRNLGAADYHALCEAATTIFISGLRQFRSNDLDFARRFITLIDLAYETRTRIVILADTRLAELFSNIAHDIEPLVSAAMTVRKEGGASSSNLTTFIGEVEWSATGLADASLAAGGAGETDVRFAIVRAVSRLSEMGRRDYGNQD